MDSLMRQLLTGIGGYQRCVTEFVRVSQTVLPKRVFYRYAPELLTGGLTPSGVPVYVQLLGSDPALMAANARRVALLGAPGIDLNFGCPAKTVNRSRGGAALLRTPDLIRSICVAVRDSVPPCTPVTAKIRLGFDSDAEFDDILRALEQAPLTELTIHARTR
ncbi:MAG: tRNA-dihydrouridine synthase, partial [Halieaceae bacterium]